MSDALADRTGEHMAGTYYPEREDKDEPSPLRDRSSIQKDCAEWFDRQIKFADSLDNVQVDLLEFQGIKRERRVSIEAQVLAHQMLMQMLKDKKQEFEEWLKTNA